MLGAAVGALVWLDPTGDGPGGDKATPDAARLTSFVQSKDVPLAQLSEGDDVRALYPIVSRAERAALIDGEGVTFTVEVDGQLIEVTTAADTFADALAQAGIEVGWEDEVAIDLSSAPVEGAEVRVGRVTTSVVTENVVTPHETQERESSSLDIGKTRVVQEGVDGTADVTSTVRYVDGVEASRTALLSVVLTEPVTEVVEVGTRKPAPVVASGSGGSSGGASGGSSGESSDGGSSGGDSSSGGSAGTSAEYSLSQFKRAGVINWDGKKFTYYSQSVLPGNGLKIPGRHVNDSGYVADENGYIVLAAPRGVAHGTVYSTPFGYSGKVYDTCASCSSSPLWLDVYIR
ncbi:G5 domain-containing protein [Salana multivorans]